jgi:hypothetical protein
MVVKIKYSFYHKAFLFVFPVLIPFIPNVVWFFTLSASLSFSYICQKLTFLYSTFLNLCWYYTSKIFYFISMLDPKTHIIFQRHITLKFNYNWDTWLLFHISYFYIEQAGSSSIASDLHSGGALFKYINLDTKHSDLAVSWLSSALPGNVRIVR